MKSRIHCLVTAAVLFVCFHDPSALWADPLFRARMDIPIVSIPNSVTLDDLNGDGIQDLVVAKVEADTVAVLLGRGDGTFQARGSYPTADQPLEIVTGDLDGNGSADLAVCCSDLVSVLLGNGNGTFGEQTNYDVGNSPRSVALDDLNSDGHLDLAVVNFQSDNISVLLGLGDGTFPSQVSYPADDGPISIATGDLDNDGSLDLAVAHGGSSSVGVRLGNGDGTFQAAMNVIDWGTGSPSSISLADLDGDGVLDLVSTRNIYNVSHDPTSYSVVQIGLGNGDGAFRGGGSYEFDGDDIYSSYASVAIGDLNNDDSPDLAVTSNIHDDVTLLINNGTGVFQIIGTLEVSGEPRSIAIADLDGNGSPDLATANHGAREVSVILGAGGGSFHTAENYHLGDSPGLVSNLDLDGDGALAESVSICDLDGNGALDLAAANGEDVAVLMGIGDGTFQSSVSYSGGPWAIELVAEDFNGDGVPDLATIGHLGIAVLLGNGDGSLQQAQTLCVCDSSGSMVSDDLNGDGHPDLIAWQGDNDELLVLLCNGDGTFQDAVSYPVGDRPCHLAVGDWNVDGAPDLACANSLSHNLSILLGNGDGTFQGAVNYPTDNGPIQVVVGDWNDDGSPDLATAIYAGGYVAIFLGNGNGSFQSAVNYDTAADASSVAVGDLDNDGISDLVTANSYNNLTVLRGNGDGTFEEGVIIAVPGPYAGNPAPYVVHIADLDGDNVPDLTVQKYNWYNIAILIGNGDGSFGSPLLYGFDSNPHCVVIGDLDGDGDPDLVVRNSDVSVLLNLRSTISADLVCSPSSGTLPFQSLFQAAMTNNYAGQARRLQYTINVTLAGGQYYSSWRRGWQNIMAGETYGLQWWQSIPDLPSLEGLNSFDMTVADVTPAPYNLPPYPPAGDTDTGSCTVSGVAP